jgi:hypothetical protein
VSSKNNNLQPVSGPLDAAHASFGGSADAAGKLKNMKNNRSNTLQELVKTTDEIKCLINNKYPNWFAYDVPNEEFETGGLFGQLAKAAGIKSPGAYALVNSWNGWNKPVSELVEIFRPVEGEFQAAHL